MSDRASKALAEDYLPGEPRTYDTRSKRSGVPLSTLYYRNHGRPSKEEKAQGQQYVIRTSGVFIVLCSSTGVVPRQCCYLWGSRRVNVSCRTRGQGRTLRPSFRKSLCRFDIEGGFWISRYGGPTCRSSARSSTSIEASFFTIVSKAHNWSRKVSDLV